MQNSGCARDSAHRGGQESEGGSGQNPGGKGTSKGTGTAGDSGGGESGKGRVSGGAGNSGAAMFAASRAQPGLFRMVGLRKPTGNFKPLNKR